MTDNVLYGRMELRLNDAEKALTRFQTRLDRSMNGMEARTRKASEIMQSSLSKGFNFSGLTAVIAGAGSLRGFQELVDASTRVQNALKVAGLSGTQLALVYDELYDSAQRNSAPLESLATLYGRLAVVQGELNVSQRDLLAFTDKTALALRVAGTDAQSASGALLQLSQALGAGTVRAEEFNSIQEGALPILQAAARGIVEAGGSVAKLRKLVLDGRLSSEAFFRGFLAGSDQLEKQAASSVSTVAQAFTRLQNALQDAAGRLNETTGASRTAVDLLGKMATYVTDLSTAFGTLADGPIGTAISKLGEISAIIETLLPQIAAIKNLPGNLQTAGDFIKGLAPDYRDFVNQRKNLADQLKRLQTEGLDEYGQEYVDAASPALKEQIRALDQKLALLYGHDTRFGITPKATSTTSDSAVSIRDYATTSTKPGGAKALDDYARAVKATNDQTTAISAQTAAMAALNPLVKDHGYQLDFVKKQQELLTAARDAGKKVDATLAADIAQTADAYAKAQAAAAKLAEEQQRIRESIEFQKDIVNGVLSDMRTALEDGKLSWEDLGNVAVNVLNKIADKLQSMLVDQLFEGFGGFFGSLVGGVSGVGGIGAVGAGGIGAGALASSAVAKAPSLQSIAKSQSVAVDVKTYVDETGNWQAKVEKISGGVAAKTMNVGLRKYRDNQLHEDISSHMRQPRRRGSI
ncbi:tape measure protein [Rhizobium sp.]